MSFVLASASPRRADLLRAAAFEFRVIVPDVDERARDGETPEACAQRLAEAKARAVIERAAGELVLGADTIVVVDHACLGKPADAADAARMLRLLAGRVHRVVTGVALCGPEAGICRVETTLVHVAALTDEDIAWYVASGEPMDKAGAYAIQGLASRFITRIEGSYSNVVGLPIPTVAEMMDRFSDRSRSGSTT